MSNPLDVEIDPEQWVKIASEVCYGKLWLIKLQERYNYTYRVAGEPAPSNGVEDGVPIQDPSFIISSVEAVDIYIWVTPNKPGSKGLIRFENNFNYVTSTSKADDGTSFINTNPLGSLITWGRADDILKDASDPLKDIYEYYKDSELIGKIEVTYENICKKKQIRWRALDI